MNFTNSKAAANYCFNQIYKECKDKDFRSEWYEC